MPSPEERLSQLELIISEMLAKQDALAANVDQLSTKTDQISTQVRQMNAATLNRFDDQQKQLTGLENRMGKLEIAVGHGFLGVHQRLTDLFTLLGERIK